MTVLAGDDEPGVRDGRGVSSDPFAADRGRDAVQRLLATGLPDLRAQQPRGLRDETMPEVGEHDVVVAVGDRVVEGDRPLGPGQRVGQSDLRQRPGIGQRADAVAPCTAVPDGFSAAGGPAPARPRRPVRRRPA